jgi:tetratricopeptide (TPR) repeat protein
VAIAAAACFGAPSPPVAHAGIELRPDEARTLCLSAPVGATPIDDALRAAAARAHTPSPRAEDWVRLGWEWVRKARLAGDPGFYVNVTGCSDEALRAAPNDVGALELRALVLMNEHRFEEARALAADVVAVRPDDTVALGVLSDALLELGRFAEAAAAAQREADLKPDAAAYVRASYFRWLGGDTAGSKRFVRLALGGRDRRDPEPAAWTFVEAAKIFWHEGDYRGADAVLAEALRWVPEYAPALAMRGRVALGRGRPEEAVVYLARAHHIQPLPETAWILADARARLGDAAGAEAEVGRVVETGRRVDRLTLALFYATKNRDIDEALRLVEEERAGRGGVYVDDAYAWVLYRAGRITEARAASLRARRLGTPDARILYHAGAIDLAAGVGTGRALVARALALNPEFDPTGAPEARALLARHAS